MISKRLRCYCKSWIVRRRRFMNIFYEFYMYYMHWIFISVTRKPCMKPNKILRLYIVTLLLGILQRLWRVNFLVFCF